MQGRPRKKRARGQALPKRHKKYDLDAIPHVHKAILNSGGKTGGEGGGGHPPIISDFPNVMYNSYVLAHRRQ